MRICIVGGGPAGLYFALLMKQLRAGDDITVLERDGPDDTFGWGIVFSSRTFGFLADSDPPSHRRIVVSAITWDDVIVVHRGERVVIGGNRFSGIGRLAFLRILHDRCRDLGVDLRFHATVAGAEDVPACDLLVGADGANSVVRHFGRDGFEPSLAHGRNKYIWLGTTRAFDGLTLVFKQHRLGLFIAHAYRFDATRSTFIVECSDVAWRAAGFDRRSAADTCALLEEIFADELGGQPLLTNGFVRWLNFRLVRNRRWWHDQVVLLGDALHTAHFSIGSGTRLALEDAISLATAFGEERAIATALDRFEHTRRPDVERFQADAGESLRWFEEADRYLALEPLPFAYRVMTRSGRVDRERLRHRDSAFVDRVERWERASGISS